MAPYEAVYDLRLTHASSSLGPRAATGISESKLTDTCDGWDLKSHVVLNLAFRDDEVSSNERFFSSWESKDGKTYRFAAHTIKNGNVVEDYKGTATFQRSGTGRATYEAPPVKEGGKPRTFTITLPHGTLLPMTYTKELIDQATRGEPLFRSIVLNGAASRGPRIMSTAIGPAILPPHLTEADDVDISLLSAPAWRMSVAYFNLGERRDMPNTEMFMQMHGTGINESFEQTFTDSTLSAHLQRLRRVDPPNCGAKR